MDNPEGIAGGRGLAIINFASSQFDGQLVACYNLNIICPETYHSRGGVLGACWPLESSLERATLACGHQLHIHESNLQFLV